MIHKGKVRVIAFDADDTLWDCQGHFERVMQHLYELLLPWTGSREASARELFATERKNMPLLGFGTKAFTLSVLETAMRTSHGELPMSQRAAGAARHAPARGQGDARGPAAFALQARGLHQGRAARPGA